MRVVAPLPDGNVRVRFTQVCAGHNGGEKAAFPPPVAARYVELGWAEYVDFAEPAKEKPGDRKGPAPAAPRQDGPKRPEHRKKR